MIYVDEQQKSIPNRQWVFSEYSHLIADTRKELFVFALRMGLKRSQFRKKPFPHFKLTRQNRLKAVALGANEDIDSLLNCIASWNSLRSR